MHGRGDAEEFRAWSAGRLAAAAALLLAAVAATYADALGAPFQFDDWWAVAGDPRVQSLSFGLMDFVSAHQGAIPASAMSAQGQFEHPLVRRAKLEISAACHAAVSVSRPKSAT